MCEVQSVDEFIARSAARLRTRAGRGSAVGAVVVAVAQGTGAVVLTQDVVDLRALAEGTDPGVVVQRV
jgi:hypothetical protein